MEEAAAAAAAAAASGGGDVKMETTNGAAVPPPPRARASTGLSSEDPDAKEVKIYGTSFRLRNLAGCM